MVHKYKEKEEALKLRRDGKTYREILEKVNVSKSSLSLWLREAQLSKQQVQRITVLKRKAMLRGAEARKDQRIRSTGEIVKEAIREVGKMSKREKLLVGVALYWAEGSKQKPWRTSERLRFANSDPSMIEFFMHWLLDILGIEMSEIQCRLAIHENHKYRTQEVLRYWKGVTGIPEEQFSKVLYKKHKPKSNRRNNNPDEYNGLVDIMIRRSTDLNRKVTGWYTGIARNSK